MSSDTTEGALSGWQLRKAEAADNVRLVERSVTYETTLDTLVSVDSVVGGVEADFSASARRSTLSSIPVGVLVPVIS